MTSVAMRSHATTELHTGTVLADVASIAKDTASSPAFKVAAVYTATSVAKKFLTKRVATRLAARVGSEFVPFVGQAATVYLVGQAVWEGFSWYKDQINGGACQF